MSEQLRAPWRGWPGRPPCAGAPLARILAECDISQRELARRSGVSRQTVLHACHGRAVSFDTWLRICRALDVTLTELDPDTAALVASIL
jgi:DNA-binding Xre family transcriptional regulator